MVKKGCSLYATMHAYQWVTGDKRTTSNAAALINEFLGCNGTTSMQVQDWKNNNSYTNYLKSNYNVKVETPSMSESALAAFFDRGGALKVYTPNGTHFLTAVGSVVDDIDNNGSSETWIHVIDSAAYFTFNTSYESITGCRTYTSHTALNKTLLDTRNSAGRTNNRKEDNYAALEYWVPYNTFSKFGIVVGYLPGGSTAPTATTLQFSNVTYPKTFRINTSAGWSLGGGTLASNSPLTSIRSQIISSSGAVISDSGTVSISGYSYAVRSLDNDYSGATDNGVRFSRINSAGTYKWVLTGTDSAGRSLPLVMPFEANTTGSTSPSTASISYTDKVPVTGVDATPYFTQYGEAVYIGGEVDAAATVYPSNATDKTVSWSSSNTAVATVRATSESQARITGVSKGTAVITCRTNDGGYTSSFTVNVLKDVTGIQLSPTTLTLNVEDTYKLTAAVQPTDASNQTVHWSSSDTTVVATDYYEVGTIKALKTGTATITAMSERGGYTATCVVTVVQPVQSITLSSRSLSMNVGDTATISASIFPSTATNKSVTWSTTNSAVATVSSGRITAVGAGMATIICTANDGSGVTARCTVTVSDSHAHTLVMIAPIPASSTENGRSIGLRCSDCNEIMLQQTVIDAGWVLALPKGLQCVEEEAFTGADMEQINVPEGMTEIKARAFADCKSLMLVTIPDSVTTIAESAFSGCNETYFCIVADAGSAAAKYAKNHGYQLWSPGTSYTVHFDLNGASGSIADIVVENGAPLGTLPTAVRDYFRFDGWYTEPVYGSRVSAETIYDNRTETLTLYARWTENAYSDWVTAVPAGARIVDTKTQYRYRDTTYSTVYSSWSAWGDWTTTRETTSDLKKEEAATVYGWYWFQCPNCGAHWHVWSGLAIDCSPTWGPGGGCGNDNIQSTDGHIVWNTTPWSSGTANWCGTGKICLGSDIKTRMFAWTDGGSAREGYRYATRTSSQQASVGAWSSWSDTAVSSSSTREVETRRLVRYQAK